MADKNVCLWCGNDCTFLSTCRGMCLGCGDLLQKAGVPYLLKTLAEGAQQVHTLHMQLKALVLENKELKKNLFKELLAQGKVEDKYGKEEDKPVRD